MILETFPKGKELERIDPTEDCGANRSTRASTNLSHAPKPVGKKARFHVRDLEHWLRTRVWGRGEAFLGAAGRIRARHDGENAAASRGERIAIYGHYSSTGRVSAMVQSQLATYAAQGFEVIFVSMCASLNGDDVARLQKICRTVIARRSFGRDFGA